MVQISLQNSPGKVVFYGWVPRNPSLGTNGSSAVVDTTFVDIYVDTKNIPTCRYNIQHIDKRTMENKMSIIMWEVAMSYATTFK